MDSFNFEQFFKDAKANLKPPLPDPLEYTGFELAPVEKPFSIVDGLLDSGSRMIVGGGSKTYKTWMMSELALAIVTGTPWWNFETHQVPVLYVNFELKDFYAQSRFKAIRKAKKLNVPSDVFFIWNLRGYDVALLEFKAKLLELIETYAIRLVFIDPFYRLLGVNDERVSAELMPVLMCFEEINRLTGAAIVCAAHFTKGNQAAKDPLDRISGGASLNRHPDCLLTLTKHKEDHAFTVDMVFRDFAPIEPFVVKWVHPLLVADSSLDPGQIKTPRPKRTSSYVQEDIVKLLAAHDDELGTNQLQKMVSEETGMSRPRFYQLWNELQNTKAVFRSKLSGKWNLAVH